MYSQETNINRITKDQRVRCKTVSDSVHQRWIKIDFIKVLLKNDHKQYIWTERRVINLLGNRLFSIINFSISVEVK